MKRILVPCDFSQPAIEAFQSALEIAHASNGDITVAHAIEMPLLTETAFGIQPYPIDAAMTKKMEDEAEKAFQRLKERYNGTDKVQFKILYDFLIPSLRSFIEENEIDLVVMGTHGTGGLSELLIGSNTEKIVRFSTVPVISIRKAPNYASIKKIVLASSLELNQHEFIDRVKKLQEFFQATLHVVLINTPDHFKTDKDAAEALNDFVIHYKLTNYSVYFRSNFSERDGILHFAEEIRADLIAVATHSRKGLKHLLEGSIAESVVNHQHCPVWTYSLANKLT